MLSALLGPEKLIKDLDYSNLVKAFSVKRFSSFSTLLSQKLSKPSESNPEYVATTPEEYKFNVLY